MKIEHFAINVEDPAAMADWYARNMGLKIVKQAKEAPFMTFLADNSGRVMIEIYRNSSGVVPDYKNMNPLTMHIAYVSKNPGKDKKRLLNAGATLESDDKPEDGSHLIMMRDPWGICIQLCRRGTSLLAEKELTV